MGGQRGTQLAHRHPRFSAQHNNEASNTPHGGVLLLEQSAQLLVELASLLRQLRVPQAHAAARLINQIDSLRRVGREPADQPAPIIMFGNA